MSVGSGRRYGYADREGFADGGNPASTSGLYGDFNRGVRGASSGRRLDGGLSEPGCSRKCPPGSRCCGGVQRGVYTFARAPRSAGGVVAPDAAPSTGGRGGGGGGGRPASGGVALGSGATDSRSALHPRDWAQSIRPRAPRAVFSRSRRDAGAAADSPPSSERSSSSSSGAAAGGKQGGPSPRSVLDPDWDRALRPADRAPSFPRAKRPALHSGGGGANEGLSAESSAEIRDQAANLKARVHNSDLITSPNCLLLFAYRTSEPEPPEKSRFPALT